MKLLIMQFSPISCHFISLQTNILLSTLFSNTLSLCLMKLMGKILVPFLKHGLNIKKNTARKACTSTPASFNPCLQLLNLGFDVW
jgi:hypothetical protein